MKISIVKDMGRAVLAIEKKNSEPIDSEKKVEINQRIAAFYDMFAQEMPDGVPWNWGLFEDSLDREIRANLEHYDGGRSDGYSEQLYLHTLKQAQHETTDVPRILEVGCGVGYGLNFLARLDDSARYVGLDLSQAAIDRAQINLSRTSRLQFVQGNAESLPFEDEYFDTVINLESSHNYPNLERFYSEVARVLKPGGYFSLVDLFTKARLEEVKRAKIQTTGLKWLPDEDISELVRAAILRRLQPTSKLRENIKRKASFPMSLLAGISVAAGYGGDFVDYRGGIYGVMKKIFLFGSKQHLVDCYLSIRAVKI